MRKRFGLVVVGILFSVLRPVELWSAIAVDSAAVTPGTAPVGVVTTVTVTALISDPSVIPGGVNLQRLDAAGRVIGVLGNLHDDGTSGDAVAGDRTFTFRSTIFEQTPGTVFLRVSAAFRGVLLRAFSRTLSVNITATAPSIAILSPANLALLNTSPVNVTGTVDDPGAVVSVNGILASVSGGVFQASVPLVEGNNTLTASATSTGGTSTATVQVTLDTTPPHVTIESPADGFHTTDAAITVSGTANDIVVGTVNSQQVTVTVNGLPAQVANGTFQVSGVPLALGLNTIEAVGRDRVGNSATTRVQVTRDPLSQLRILVDSGDHQSGPVSTTLPAPLVVVLVDGQNNRVGFGVTVVFRVTENDGLVTGDSGVAMALATAVADADGNSRVLFTLGSRAGAGGNRVEATAVGFAGVAVFTATGVAAVDTDGDGIPDSEEVVLGADGFITNPLLADTDGDGVRDALEIATGSDPTNPNSLNLASALSQIAVTPSSFGLTVNVIEGVASQQLSVTGSLRDGTSIDLTSTNRGTSYFSSDLNSCKFGSPDGRVFGGSDGLCTITVTSHGFAAMAFGTVNSFSPMPLSFVSIPGFANNVDVNGNFAYVAAGSTGLQVVNVTNRASPVIVASVNTPGNANDVSVVGNLAFVADGSSGLQIIDITNPLAPTIVGALDTPGDAWDVVVRDNLAYVADGFTGLQVVDVSDPLNPQLLGSVDPPGTQKGVDVDPVWHIAVLASGTSGIHVVDVLNPASPTLIGTVSTGGDARDVVLKGNFAFVADFSRSFVSVDLTDPRNPVVRAATPSNLGGLLQDVTADSSHFAFGADVLFVNGVPIIDVIDAANPVPRAILNFSAFRDDNGTGIAVDSSFVYLTAERGLGTENGTTGDTRLYIGQYRAPVLQIVGPSENSPH